MITIEANVIVDCARKSIEQERGHFIPVLSDKEISDIMRKFVKKLNEGRSPGPSWEVCVSHLGERRQRYLATQNGQ